MADAPGPGQRPVPQVTPDDAFFWEAAAAGQLAVQQCGGCGQLRHPPRPGCPACRSLEWTAAVLSGTGTIYSFAVHHRPPVPGLPVPVIVVLVALAEGPRIVSTLTGTEPDSVAIGQPVTVVFTPLPGGVVLPEFRCAQPL